MKNAAARVSRMCLLALAAGALAPVATAQDVQFGLKGGLSLATFGGEDSALANVEPDMRTGFAVGAFLAFPLGNSLSLQPEALFVQKGAQYDFEGLAAKLKVDYVEVPLFLKARFGGDRFRPYVLAGPYVAFRIQAEGEGEGQGGTTTTDLEEETRSTDYGIAGGAGVEIGTGGALVLEARYSRGLTTVDSRDEPAVTDLQNSAWSLLVGFRF